MSTFETTPPSSPPNQPPEAPPTREASHAVYRRSPISRLLGSVSGYGGDGTNRHEARRAAAGGLLLLMTASMALGSGSLFAHDLVKLDWPFALAVGVFWGVLVFSFDRYIIIALDDARGTRRLVTGLLRLAMAALLGFVVAEPFVLRVFDTEVAEQLASTNETAWQDAQKQIAANDDYGIKAQKTAQAEVDRLQLLAAADGPNQAAVDEDAAVVRLQKEYDDAVAAANAQNKLVSCEDKGSCGTGQAGAGPEWERKKAVLDQLWQDAAGVKAELQKARDDAAKQSASMVEKAAVDARRALPAAKADLTKIKHDRAEALVTRKDAIYNAQGLGAQMHALDQLKEHNSSIRLEWMLITLLLVVVDTSAVGLKLMQPESTSSQIAAIENATAIAQAELRRDHEVRVTEADLVADAEAHAADRDLFGGIQDDLRQQAADESRAQAEDTVRLGPRRIFQQVHDEFGERLDGRYRPGRRGPAQSA